MHLDTAMRIALYPGTFDPLTNGHLSLIRRGCEVFDQIVVAVADSTPKFPLFSHEERVEMARVALKDEPRAIVEPISGLTVEYAAQRGACALPLRSGQVSGGAAGAGRSAHTGCKSGRAHMIGSGRA